MSTTHENHEGDDAGHHEPAAVPQIVDRATWQAARDELLVREKAHTREGDAIAAARRRLPMTEVDARRTRSSSSIRTASTAARSSWSTGTCGSWARRSRTSARAAP